MGANHKSPTNVDVVILALAHLGGASMKVHSEEIAARAVELAPDKFCWRLQKYREKGWPDKELVRAALVNAQTEEYGQLVSGAYNTDLSKDGWGLTSAGSEWITANEQRILDGLSAGQAQIPKREAQRFCTRLRRETLFKRFLADGNLSSATQYQFSDLLECSPDAPRETIQTKFDRLRAMAYVVKDEVILAFLAACSAQFASLLRKEVLP